MQTDLSKCLCSLDEKISCPFRMDGGLCSDKNKKCGFVIKVVTEPTLKPYVRKPRWYEKYYEGTRTRRVW